MSKAAHNGCQARADIPTGLGMHQESTFAMSRLRHKRAVGKILPTVASVWVRSFSPPRRLRLTAPVVSLPNQQHLGCKLNSFQFYCASKVVASSASAVIYQDLSRDWC